MKMNIRRASENDLEEISILENSSFKNPFNKENLLYEISKNPVSRFYVLVQEDKIIGFIDFWVTFDSATIDQICVKEEERNKGFASLLLENAINDVRNEGVEFFTLEVRKSNINAIKLYEKFGFQHVTIKPKYYDDGEDAIYMVKGLI